MSVPILEGDAGKLEEKLNKTEGRATLRLKQDGQAVVEEVVRIIVQSLNGFLLYIKCIKSYMLYSDYIVVYNFTIYLVKAQRRHVIHGSSEV